MGESLLGPVLTAAAAHTLQLFEGHNARVPHSPVVHGMTSARWLDVRVPGLACNTAVGGWEWTRLVPVAAPVTCSRCLRLGAGEDAAVQRSAQLMLNLTVHR